MCLEPTLIHKTNILFIILLTKVPEPSQLVIPLTNSVWLHHICTQLNISWKQELINIEVFFSSTKSLHCSSTSSVSGHKFLDPLCSLLNILPCSSPIIIASGCPNLLAN